MPRRHCELPTPQEFATSLQEQVRRYLRTLDRDQGLAMLRDLEARLADEDRMIRTIEQARHELLDAIASAPDYTTLRHIEEGLTRQETERFLLAQSVPALHHSCTEYRDQLAARTVEMVTAELVADGLGAPPVPFALISMGSDGREEQTLITDQDYLVVYGDGGATATDAYFREHSERLVERLAEVGFKKCTGDIMPSNPTWRGSRSQWRQRLHAIVRYEFEDYAKNLMDLIVLSDVRFVAGDPQIAAAHIELIRDFEQSYFQVIWGMAKEAAEMRVGLTWFKRLWTDRSGEHRGLFNVKLLGWAPLVMNVRILAVNLGLEATSTLQRLTLLQERRSLSPGTTAELRAAYLTLTRQRILLQIRHLRGEQSDSYHLDPLTLSDEEREELRQALISIEELQKIIRTNFTIL